MKSLALFLLTTTAAMCAPPEGADPALAPYYQSLQQPGTGYLCCSLADCRNVETRDRDGHVEVFISAKQFYHGPDDWVIVPDAVVLRGKENPTGQPIACFLAGEVRCFVPGTGT